MTKTCGARLLRDDGEYRCTRRPDHIGRKHETTLADGYTFAWDPPLDASVDLREHRSGEAQACEKCGVVEDAPPHHAGLMRSSDGVVHCRDGLACQARLPPRSETPRFQVGDQVVTPDRDVLREWRSQGGVVVAVARHEVQVWLRTLNTAVWFYGEQISHDPSGQRRESALPDRFRAVLFEIDNACTNAKAPRDDRYEAVRAICIRELFPDDKG